ncbi:MAG: tRNA pseudouridine(13) synthase TruD [Planctomycetota bacterium]|nr:tRNA pseudouridine(13) synthase TruD [Planctomycetota bacterium]
MSPDAEGGATGASGARPGTHAAPRAYVTPEQAGLGGVLKERPEDFLVDEIPLYQPSGEGEHIYLLVQKRGMSTMEMVQVVARHFGVRRAAVGYAGLKDKRAITRQVVSVHTPGKTFHEFPMLQHESVQVLWADMHANKLRPGHLKGNRFSVKIRGVPPTGVLTARAVLERLRATGVPNRIGEQRFGLLENNHLVGRELVKGDFEAAARELLGASAEHPEMNTEARALFAEGRFREALMKYPPGARTELIVLNGLSQGLDAKRAFMRLDEPVLRYYLSAFQSAVFNDVLDARVIDGTLGTLRTGDLAFKHINGAVFAVDEPTQADPATAQRLATFEISPSGPMWGASMPLASGVVGEAESAALARVGVTPADLAAFDLRARGTLEGKRRPLRVPLIDPEVEGGVDEHGAYVRCAFELPRGSFATVVMREVMKPARERDADAEEGA